MLALNRRNSLFNDLLWDVFGDSAHSAHYAPYTDVHSDEEKVVVEMELPGVRLEDTEISVESGVLTVKGERKSGESVRKFSKSFTISNTLDPERIEARSELGIVTITIPKIKKALPKKIKILPK